MLCWRGTSTSNFTCVCVCIRNVNWTCKRVEGQTLSRWRWLSCRIVTCLALSLVDQSPQHQRRFHSALFVCISPSLWKLGVEREYKDDTMSWSKIHRWHDITEALDAERHHKSDQLLDYRYVMCVSMKTIWKKINNWLCDYNWGSLFQLHQVGSQ